MIARRPGQPDRPVVDRVPANIIKRPLRLSPMKRIKDAGKVCTCRQPVSFHHTDGHVTCVRCRGHIAEVEE